LCEWVCWKSEAWILRDLVCLRMSSMELLHKAYINVACWLFYPPASK
jgi:hypothetical protein